MSVADCVSVQPGGRAGGGGSKRQGHEQVPHRTERLWVRRLHMDEYTSVNFTMQEKVLERIQMYSHINQNYYFRWMDTN